MTEKKSSIDSGNIEKDLLTFLYASISDMQGTIRAVDAKIGFLLIALGIPIGALGKIFGTLSKVHGLTLPGCGRVLFWIFIAAFISSWLLSFISALMALVSIHNPRKHVSMRTENGGSYFRGGLFNFNFLDNFSNRNWFNTKGPLSRCSLPELVETLPRTNIDLMNELVFEQIKLAYIRDTKILRQNTAYLCSTIWLGLGFVGWIIALISGR